MNKQDTPNKRLARVLRLLADVIEADARSVKAYEALASASCAYSPCMRVAEIAAHLQDAEQLATEAARLAGVPLPEPYRPEEKTDEQR